MIVMDSIGVQLILNKSKGESIMRKIVINTALIRGHLNGRIDLICKRAGMSRETLRKKLRGQIGWKVEDLNRICEALRINADDVVGTESYQE